jgi:UDP-xylose/UDP-N-acetylglucosamine transporter B4
MTGTFLTFAQFLYVTFQTASSQLHFPSQGGKSTWIPRIRKREVPMGRWLVQVVLFLAVSLSEHCSCGVVEGKLIVVNNYAFGLKVSSVSYCED